MVDDAESEGGGIDRSSAGWKLFSFFNARPRVSKWALVIGGELLLVLGEILNVLMGGAILGK